jgi:hypothetical protein
MNTKNNLVAELAGLVAQMASKVAQLAVPSESVPQAPIEQPKTVAPKAKTHVENIKEVLGDQAMDADQQLPVCW